MTRHPSLLLAAFALALVTATPAAAQEEARAAAQKKMAAGAQLLDQGQPAEALRLFREAYTTFPNQRWQYSIGIACQATGRNLEALEAFQTFLENAQGAPQVNVDDAKKQVEVLRARVASVRITAKQAGAGVLVDGREVGRTPLPRPVLLEPGEHNFMVRKTEFEPFERALTLKGGEEATLAAELRPIVKAAAPPPVAIVAPPVAPPPPAETPLYQRWWLWTAVGAVVVTGVVIAIASSSGSKSPQCSGGITCVP